MSQDESVDSTSNKMWETSHIRVTNTFTGESYEVTYTFISNKDTHCSWCDRKILIPSPYFPDCCDGGCGKAELRELIKTYGMTIDLEDELAEYGFVRGGSASDKAERAYGNPLIVNTILKHYGFSNVE